MCYDTIRCLHCKKDVDHQKSILEEVKHFNECENENAAAWKQFLENISKVFIFLVKHNFVPSCPNDIAEEIVRMSLFYQDDNHAVLFPAYIRNQTRHALLLIFAQNNLDLLITNLNGLVTTPSQNKYLRIDCCRTLDFLLAVIECLLSNHISLQYSVEAPGFIRDLLKIAGVKRELKTFCQQIVDKSKHGNISQVTIPKPLDKILKEGTSECCHHLRNLFIKIICLDHGMQFHAKVIQETKLERLIPEILRKKQRQDFADIFLVIPNYQNTLTEFLGALSFNLQDAILTLETKDSLMANLILYRYLVDCGKDKAPSEIAQNQKLKLMERVCDENDILSPLKDQKHLDHHFFFLLNAVFLSESLKKSILVPLRSICVEGANENNLLLPTFPDYLRQMKEINSAIADFTTWNVCSNGHRYLIGNCGEPNQAGLCPECNEPIGGASMHEFTQGNKKLGKRGESLSEKTSGTRVTLNQLPKT